MKKFLIIIGILLIGVGAFVYFFFISAKKVSYELEFEFEKEVNLVDYKSDLPCTINHKFDTSKMGDYTYKYRCSDSKKSYDVTLKYTVLKFSDVNLDLDIYKEANVSDFSSQIPCLEDHKFDTDKLGEYDYSYRCNSDEDMYRINVKYNVLDREKPLVLARDSYSVTRNYDKPVSELMLAIDNYDKDITKEIIGEYDLTRVGNYNLTLNVKDSSGNISSNDFVLKVIEKTNNKTTTSNSFLAFSEMRDKYKTNDTKVGIDVSKWQGDIDFSKVKAAGAEFVMIRIGYQDGFDGEYVVDPYYEKNIAGALENGLDVGVYFYTYSKNSEEAVKQAEWIVEKLNGQKLALPIVFDWESWSSLNSIKTSIHDFNEMANAFLAKVTEKGYEGMLYSSKNYLEKIWYKSDYKTWLAHYTFNTNYEGDYYMWQMCSDGRIDGIKGDVDIDILYLNK